MSDTIERLRRQLAEAEENLRLVRERRSEYVQATDVPLQLCRPGMAQVDCGRANTDRYADYNTYPNVRHR